MLMGRCRSVGRLFLLRGPTYAELHPSATYVGRHAKSPVTTGLNFREGRGAEIGVKWATGSLQDEEGRPNTTATTRRRPRRGKMQ